MVSKQERITGGLIGLLVGDALGVPYEFHPPQEIPAIAEIEFEPPLCYSHSHAQVLPGTWSDDGAQAHCLLASFPQ
jgi:ADP-ribosyl-[dinitrogen reductase] hydrolase